MKTVPNSNRVIRVAPQLHKLAKVVAAEEGIALRELVGEALERELARRARRLAKSGDTIAASLAPITPHQTR